MFKSIGFLLLATLTFASHECNPSIGCNVCAQCCASYIPDGASCDACVAAQCPNECNPSSGCNVCAQCCASYIPDGASCDACVAAQCTAPNECNPSMGCNVCQACCTSYISDGANCDACVSAQCGGSPTPGPFNPTPAPAPPTPAPAPPTSSPPPITGGLVGAYLDLAKGAIGMTQLNKLAVNAATLPFNRLYISFLSPNMVYKPGSNTLTGVGLDATTSASDAGFAEIKVAIAKLAAGGVETFFSMGGWNYNCFPGLYMRYSVGGYGNHTPNYWKIQKYGAGNLNSCTESNQWCYVCEPPSEGTTIKSFSIFPEPAQSKTWAAAKSFVEQYAKGTEAPKWNEDMVPGSSWTDTKTGTSFTVPGTNDWKTQNRDPYADIVYLAKDIGAAGIDLDYEEMWHADYFRAEKSTGGPWYLWQTVYKYSAILKDMELNIQAIYPTCKISTAAGAVSAWSGNWWGGNLKGVMYYIQQWMPNILDFMTKGKNAGGVNVMTYDLSSNEDFYECPESGICDLDKQVDYYMKTYSDAGITANVGYEIGQPAYPSIENDASHQLPLTTTMLQSIISTTQANVKGGFIWEIYKPAKSGQSTPEQTLQAICKAVLGADQRCSGSIPAV